MSSNGRISNYIYNIIYIYEYIIDLIDVRKFGELAPRPHAMCAAMAQVCFQGKDQPVVHKDKCTIMLETRKDMCIGHFVYWCHV